MDTDGPAVKIHNGSGVSTLHSDQSCPGTPVRLDSKTDTDPASNKALGEKRRDHEHLLTKHNKTSKLIRETKGHRGGPSYYLVSLSLSINGLWQTRKSQPYRVFINFTHQRDSRLSPLMPPANIIVQTRTNSFLSHIK